MRDDDDDGEDGQGGPSAFSKAGGFLVSNPIVSGGLFAVLGFLVIMLALPAHKAAPDAVIDVPVAEVMQEKAEAEKLPEKQVGEMQATPPEEAAETPAPVSVPVVADAALIITDVGLSRRVAEAIDKSMPVETTLAVSPYGADPAAVAKAFADTGRDVWLNVSAQSIEGGIDPGPLALSGSLGKKENLEFLKKQMDAVGPKAIGIFLPADADITKQGDLWRDVALETIAMNRMVLDGTPVKVPTELYVQKSESKISAYLKTDIVIDGAQAPAALDTALAASIPTILNLKEAIVVIEHPNAIGVERIEKWVQSLAGHGIRLVPASKFTGLKP